MAGPSEASGAVASGRAGPPRLRVVVAAAALTTVLAGLGAAGVVAPGSSRSGGCVRGDADAGTLSALLAARDRAVLAGSSGTVASGTPDAAGGTADALRHRLAGVPLAAWTNRVVSAAPAGPTDDVLSGRTTLRYRLVGDAADTVRSREVTAVRAGGCWAVRDDAPASGAVPDLWDLGPVRTERSGDVVVLASDALDPAGVRALAAAASDATKAVTAVWPPGPRPVVVLAPRTADDAASVAGTPRAALAGLAAVTYGPPSPGAAGPSEFGDSRVLVVPEGFAALTPDGRRFVLAHELTHVATNATARAAVPAWFQECFADAVGWSALGLDAAGVDRLVGDDLRGVRLTALPRRLPARADFDARGGDTARAYALADAACLALAGGPDAGRLAAVYRTASGAEPSGAEPSGAEPSGAEASGAEAYGAAPSGSVSSGGVSSGGAPSGGSGAPPGGLSGAAVPDTAVLAAAGTDEQRLLAAWHRRILDLAGPIPGSTP